MGTVTKNIVPGIAWATLTSYSLGQRATNDSPLKFYEVTTAGISGATGPTGTGSSISDGTVVWKYLTGIDYTSLTAWGAGLPANFVTDGNAQVGQGWKLSNNTGDQQDWTYTAQALSLSGHTTSSTDTLTLTAAPGEGLPDQGSALNHLRYDASNGLGLRLTSGSYLTFLSFGDANSTFSRIQVKEASTGGHNNVILWNGGTGILDSAIIDGCNGPGSEILLNTSGTGNLSRNSLFINRSVSANSYAIAASGSGTYTTAGCAFVCPSDAANVNLKTGIISSYQSVKITDCCFFGLKNPTNPSHSTATLHYCITDQANFGTTGTGGTITATDNDTTGATYSTTFANTTGASGNWELVTGSACINAGTTDTADIPAAIDIVGTSRPQGTAWCIGCWEFVSSVTTWTGSAALTAVAGLIAAAVEIELGVAALPASAGLSAGPVTFDIAQAASLPAEGFLSATAVEREVISTGLPAEAFLSVNATHTPQGVAGLPAEGFLSAAAVKSEIILGGLPAESFLSGNAINPAASTAALTAVAYLNATGAVLDVTGAALRGEAFLDVLAAQKYAGGAALLATAFLDVTTGGPPLGSAALSAQAFLYADAGIIKAIPPIAALLRLRWMSVPDLSVPTISISALPSIFDPRYLWRRWPMLGEANYTLFFCTPYTGNAPNGMTFIKPSGRAYTTSVNVFSGSDPTAGSLSPNQAFVAHIFAVDELDEVGMWTVLLASGGEGGSLNAGSGPGQFFVRYPGS